MKATLLIAGLALALAACQPQVVTKIVEVPAPKSDYQLCAERATAARHTVPTESYIVQICGKPGN